MQALRSSKLRQLLTGHHGATASSETPLEPHISPDYFFDLFLLLLLNLIPKIQDGEQTDVRLQIVYTGPLLSLKRGKTSRLLAHMHTRTRTHTRAHTHTNTHTNLVTSVHSGQLLHTLGQ